jgi:glucose/arabinose dehydrogenase
MKPRYSPSLFNLSLVFLLLGAAQIGAQPFTVQGPGVNTNDFRVTTFASGLDFPLGMAELPDGSLIVTAVQSTSFYSGTGRLLRLTDTNQNGISDAPGTVLYSGLPTTVTAVRVAGNLVLAESVATSVYVLRMGATPASPLTLVGTITPVMNINRPHPNSALAVRKTPGFTNRYDVLFQIGSENNFAASTSTVPLTNSNIPGAVGSLNGDALYMITLIDNGGTNVTATNLTQLATGLRNAAGFAFRPATGDLYLQDNGIDGLVNGNEAHSADELNFIARTNIGGAIENFGYPTNYTSYRSNVFVGGAGIAPLVAFQPIPLPFGAESEGANDLAIAPPGFPNGLNTGVFLGFHGRFNVGGVNNEENPVVYADPATGNYFHFIRGQQAGIGHLDGLMSTRDSLFIADLSTNGNIFSSTSAGAIYQIKSLVTPTPPVLSIKRVGSQIELKWERGALQEATEVTGPWTSVTDAFSPFYFSATGSRRFYRTVY